ncbi:MAG: sugar ABC transporter substrate-binding protein [Solirubrobacteraceae bacterium]
MRYPRALTLAGIVAAAAVAATGCGSGDDGGSTAASTGSQTAASTTAGEQKPVKMAYMVNTYTDYVQAEEKGARAALKPQGGSLQIFNANFDPQKQVKQCQDAVTSGRYNAIMVIPVEAPAAVPCATVAKQAGIPVLAMETAIGDDLNAIEPTVPGVVWQAPQTPEKTAAKLVELTTKACEGLDPCNIIVEIVTASDTYSNTYADAIAKEVPHAKVVAKLPGMYDPSVITKTMPDLLSAHPDTNVFVSAADSQALAAVPAIKSAGLEGKIKLIGNGGSRLGAKAVADGTLFGTLGLWPQQNGALAVKAATQAVNGQPVDPSGVDIYTVDTPSIITKENVDQFKPEWGASS